MTANDADFWDFTNPLTDASEVRCPECGQWFPLALWRDTEVGCEDCGEHSAMGCPDAACDCRIDHVWQKPKKLESRP